MMQTQPSVIDIGNSGVAPKVATAKGANDDNHFADTLNEQLQTRRLPGQKREGGESGENKTAESSPEASSALPVGSRTHKDKSSSLQADEGAEGGQEGENIADGGNILPLLGLFQELPQMKSESGLQITFEAGTEMTAAVTDNGESLVLEGAGPQMAGLLPDSDTSGEESLLGGNAEESDAGALISTSTANAREGMKAMLQQGIGLAAKGDSTLSQLSPEQSAFGLADEITASKGDGESFRNLVTASMTEVPGANRAEQANPSGLATTTQPLQAPASAGQLPLAPSLTPSSAGAPQLVLLAVGTPMQHPQWGSELGERITWMVKQDFQEAQLQLNPRHLGPIEVRISMQNEQANVQFVAHHAATREALEAALPRLREMFQETGLQMGQSAVYSQQSFQQQQQSSSSQGDMGRHGRRGDDGEGGTEPAPVVLESALTSRGIDFYA